MTETEKSLLDVVNARTAAEAAERQRLDSARADMAAYETELAAEVAKLKAKHNYDAIERRMSDANYSLDRMYVEQLRDKSILAIWAMRALFNADESACLGTREWLRDTWGIDIYSNSHVKDERFAACFAAYANEICDHAWWNLHNPVVQAGNGMLCLDQESTNSWAPCVEVCIPEKVRERLGEFLESCRSKAAALAAGWAASYVEVYKNDPEKMAALRSALGMK